MGEQFPNTPDRYWVPSPSEDSRLQSLQLSWSLTKKCFRWMDVNTEEEWLCYEADGPYYINGTDNSVGRLLVTAQLEVDASGIAHVWHPWVPSEVPPLAVEWGTGGKYRQCYNRAMKCWRWRDEDGTKKVELVRTYQGLAQLDWHDKAAHVFHLGTSYVYEDIAYPRPYPDKAPTCEW